MQSIIRPRKSVQNRFTFFLIVYFFYFIWFNWSNVNPCKLNCFFSCRDKEKKLNVERSPNGPSCVLPVDSSHPAFCWLLECCQLHLIIRLSNIYLTLDNVFLKLLLFFRIKPLLECWICLQFLWIRWTKFNGKFFFHTS